jgi:hypothetical protein
MFLSEEDGGPLRNVGTFKGNLLIMSSYFMKRLQALDMDQELEEFEIPHNSEDFEFNEVDKLIEAESVRVRVRLYVLDGLLYKDKKFVEGCKPYLKVFVGKEEIRTEHDHEENLHETSRLMVNKFYE